MLYNLHDFSFANSVLFYFTTLSVPANRETGTYKEEPTIMATVKKTAAKKETAPKAAEVVKKDVVSEAKEAAKTVVAEVKAEAAKVEAVKKEEAPKKAEAPKKSAAKKAVAPKKAPAKKAETAKKAAAPKKAGRPKAPSAAVIVEFAGKQLKTEQIIAAALKAYKASHKDVVSTIEVYVKPEESVAYYVINGVGSDDYKIEL